MSGSFTFTVFDFELPTAMAKKEKGTKFSHNFVIKAGFLVLTQWITVALCSLMYLKTCSTKLIRALLH